jgi:hypothetical protein
MTSKLMATAAALALFAAGPALAQTTQETEQRLPSAGAQPVGDAQLQTDATSGVTDRGNANAPGAAGSGGSGQIVDGQQAGSDAAEPGQLQTDATSGVTDQGHSNAPLSAGSGGTGAIVDGQQAGTAGATQDGLRTNATRGVTDAGNSDGALQPGSAGTGQIVYGEQRAPGADIPEGSGAIGSGQNAATTTGPAGAAAGAGTYSWYGEGRDFQGRLPAGYTADELIGAEVVTPDGSEVGEIEDLAVSEDGEVNHVMVDVSGWFEAERFVLLDIADMTRAEGDDASQFVLMQTRESVEAMPRYTRGDAGWSVWEGQN